MPKFRCSSPSIKAACFLPLLIALVSTAFAQKHDYWKVTKPPFGLATVQALIKKHVAAGEGEDDAVQLTEKEYNSLTLDQKFTYAMVNGEDYSQVCDTGGGPDMVADPHSQPKLYGQIPDGVEDGVKDAQRSLSDRQIAYLVKNRSRVVKLLRKTIQLNEEVGANLKGAIHLVDAYELIPDMIAAYKHDKDLNILELCLILMNDGKYQPFLASVTYRKLYGPKSNARSYIIANQANIDLTISRAMAYYRSRVK